MINLSPLEYNKLNEDIKKYYTTEGPFYLAKLYPHLSRAYILKRANKLGFRMSSLDKQQVYKENAKKSHETIKFRKTLYNQKEYKETRKTSDLIKLYNVGIMSEIQTLACSKPWGWKPPKKRRNS
jgi:hypothetical protein